MTEFAKVGYLLLANSIGFGILIGVILSILRYVWDSFFKL